MKLQNYKIIVDRQDMRQMQILEEQSSLPKDGEATLRVDKYAFTSNNITYGVVGETIGYWKFFPCQRQGWGTIPVWGFGQVVNSHAKGVEIGDRYYGYFPMAAHLTVVPEKITDRGFRDGIEHRRQLPPIYNVYDKTSADPGYIAERENHQILFRPLFATSFLLDDYVRDNDFFDASQIVLTSASSKTAIGLAYLLSKTKDEPIHTVGLTSGKNMDFVSSLTCYDEVISYANINRLGSQKKTTIVDFSGSSTTLKALAEHLGPNLAFCSKVGMVDHTAYDNTFSLGKKDRFFFAPSQAQKRNQEWGSKIFLERLSGSLNDFISFTDTWLSIIELTQRSQLKETYLDFFKGNVDPSKGYIVVNSAGQ